MYISPTYMIHLKFFKSYPINKYIFFKRNSSQIFIKPVFWYTYEIKYFVLQSNNTYIASNKTFETVMDTYNTISIGKAQTDKRTNSSINTTGGGSDIHHSKIVRVLQVKSECKKLRAMC